MQQIGKLKERDLSGFSNEDKRNYLKKLNKTVKADPKRSDSLKKITENDHVFEGLKEILLNLLTINPYFRWTASECLSHPIFDEIRVLDNEQPAIM